jgi:hypothetical protein
LRNQNLRLLASRISRYHMHHNILWTKIVDKYRVDQPYIFCCPGDPFWKGVLSAAQAARIGFRRLGGMLRMVK